MPLIQNVTSPPVATSSVKAPTVAPPPAEESMLEFGGGSTTEEVLTFFGVVFVITGVLTGVVVAFRRMVARARESAQLLRQGPVTIKMPDTPTAESDSSA